ncbi:hypothetical protein C8Q74DRAFT_1366885 [Fomes fomentarius]|nr:hypothetical protein C8Q74DRAFT_1366885 [Fomes fomentarius]
MALMPFNARAVDGVDQDVTVLAGDIPMLPPSIGAMFGTYLIGSFFGLMLYGFSLHQVYKYARLFPSDTLFIRLLVMSVMVIETIHAAFTMHTCYHYLIANYNNAAILNQGVWSLNFIPLIVGINMVISQSFFARRVYLMGKVFRIVVDISMLWFVLELGFSIAAVAKVIAIPSFDAVSKVNHLLAATFGAAFIGDALLTGSLILVLHRSRSTEPKQSVPSLRRYWNVIDDYRRTESVLDWFNLYAINTGLLHAILNVVSFIIVLSLPQDIIHGSISIITTRLYGNTLLAVLNSRKFNVITRGIEAIEGDVGMHAIARATRIAKQERWNVPQVPSPSPSAINIQVTTEMGNDSIKGYEKSEFSENPRRGGRNSVPSRMNFIVIE